ncbi:hypothetical protein [Sphingopyxis sp. BSNA05]|uniref:hypothetical protein n=1 Tax=Sphingopyxis sp. BSNA05 TaxID=1236614 RepID=UPI001C26E832|nr:hypothetical protein [Sphingopyxis sp. BSNA05]
MITDAIFEGAAQHYQDVLPSTGLSRKWFRLVGSKTVKSGAAGGFSILRFTDEGADHFFAEKGGKYPGETARNELPESLHPGVNWSDDENRTRRSNCLTGDPNPSLKMVFMLFSSQSR